MTEPQLFIVLLGGKHAQARVEVHDIIPVIYPQLEKSYPQLKQHWFGVPQGLHIDAWMCVHGVQYQGVNYRVEIVPYSKPMRSQLKLYLINLGAYLTGEFGEFHRYVVVAGMSPADARQQGKLHIEQHWHKAHTDAVIDIDECLALDLIDGYAVHLVQGNFKENHFENTYIVLD